MYPFQYQETQPLLKVDGVSLTIGETPILKNINLEIKDVVRSDKIIGQIVGLLAPSGMGKSMLFKLLAGIMQPTTGTILVGSQQTPVKAGDVGFVQQNYPLFNHRTVYGNMEVAAQMKIKDSKERKIRIDELLSRFDLLKVAKHYPAELSGGQKQRAAIVQQVLCSNEFLLLDEPTSGLDYNIKLKVMDLIQEVANLTEFSTVIIVSHDIPSTVAICEKVWIMGRERDAIGNPIPGATIKHQYDLMARDLAWHSDIELTPEFANFVNEIKSVFPTL